MTILLVRHCAVALEWRGRCYGQSDTGLSRAGWRETKALADVIAAKPVTAIIHSGLNRTRRLADRIGMRTGNTPQCDPRWQERDYGKWEGRRWTAIYRETGNEMDQMLTDPESYRPGGGETTTELLQRANAAWADLPRGGMTVIISHGGPIAMVRTILAGARVNESANFIPPIGSITEVFLHSQGMKA